MSLEIVKTFGWRLTSVTVGSSALITGLLGIIIVEEPPKEYKINEKEKKDGVFKTMYNNYKNGFKAIFFNMAAFLTLTGIILRFWEEALLNTYLSDYMKNYTDDGADKQELWNNKWYPSLAAFSSFLGGPFSNLSSMFLIGLFAEDN